MKLQQNLFLSSLFWYISVTLEVVAKLASRAKFDDFFVGSIFCKVTYPLGHRHFAKSRSQRKKHKFGSEWSFATGSILKTIDECLRSYLKCQFGSLPCIKKFLIWG